MDSKFRRFGAGCCGSVWASGKGPAFKREDGDPNRSLRNDYEIHKRVLNNLTQLADMKSKRKGIESVDKFPQIQVPQCYRSIRPHDTDWWKDNQHRLPDGYEACNTLAIRAHCAIPRAVRELSIELYCPEEIKREISMSDSNCDRLVRRCLDRT